ncbi:LutB/LldF family L-lactate oxidation iron-sulfur protein [Edaphobacter flagellatus]|uniref:LutB/LldF family L-lactate oxidation iron-sulfur protein n=1 Tax=Edaphobacter flagellatus TaxID=1933044 RepID=UPI0021B40002|nr:LutB/LldF family L-lactate oxidation iron-sulfur protein [Edaphobacter flagellatus]
MSRVPLDPRTAPTFQQAAKTLLGDAQLRKNVRHATDVIQAKRRKLVEEKQDWQQLRESARQIRAHSLQHLDVYLEEFERNFTRAGGVVHWARDAREAQSIVVGLVKQLGANEVIKIKSMTTEEIHLNNALEESGIRAYETDLAELIIQLGEDQPSHIVVPALHKNRAQIREIFRKAMDLPDLGDKPADLADAARRFLREKFLRVKTAVSGANFLIAETGGICIVESEGNGRMCLTLPETLISVVGIEKVIPRWSDLEALVQLLPRSATGERMNPYSSFWSGIHPGDGPQTMHVVLLDNGRTDVLADAEGRQTLQCIRCGACQNACPVYRQTGGHAYGSVYAGPIGAILTPQLMHMDHSQTLPYASSLCGACYEVCPVKINIPEVLIHLRNKVVEQNGWYAPESLAMKAVAFVFRSERRFRAAQRLGRIAESPLVKREKSTFPILDQEEATKSGWIGWLPGLLGGWTDTRDLQAMPKETFRDWWEKRGKA